MSGPEHGSFDGHSGEGCTELHLGTGLHVIWIFDDAREALCEESPSFPCITIAHGVSFGGNKAFEGVGEGIDSGKGRDAGWLRAGQGRIEDGDCRCGFGVPASHFHVSSSIADKSEGLHFAAGTRGGGDCD